jgi:ATP-dependent exoDNAse (exonuclease V) beta subunit
MTTGNFKVIRASAGTGKTYTLVKEYLQLALKNGTDWYYRHILAITFTNAAAAEMKERILKNLKAFSGENFTSDLLLQVAENLQLTPEEVRHRAGKVFQHMLHNYGQLGILTIDSFTSKLIRSFSKDLHLKHDFRIEINSSAFMEKVVDECMSLIGEDESLTSWMVEFAMKNAEDESDWNIREKILHIAKEIIEESAQPHLPELSEISDTDFVQIAKNLFQTTATFETEAKNIAQKGLKILEETGLKTTDLSYGNKGGMTYLRKVGEQDIFGIPGSRTLQLITNPDGWTAKKAPEDVKAKVEIIRPSLTAVLEELLTYLNPESILKYELKLLIGKNIYAMGLINKLKSISEQIREEENLLLIPDFHRMVHQIVMENDAPFIFERIGMRFKHVMIDEFQDTSLMQWENAIPLVDNSLAENHLNLIVGDAKQAIYRWRGGDASQFVNLPEINGQQKMHSAVLKQHYAFDNLTKSYRSAQSIVEFNNQLYSSLTAEQPNFEKVYDGFKQEKVKDKIGYVEVSSIEGKNKSACRPILLNRIIEIIRQNLEDGYNPGDIAILTRKGKGEGDQIAAALIEGGFHVVTKESLLADHSPVVRAVTAYMNMLFVPSDKFASASLLQALADIHPEISLSSFYEKYTVTGGKKPVFNYHEFLNNHFGVYDPISITTSPIEATLHILNRFRLTPDSGLELFLEKMKSMCVEGNLSTTEFLQWWKDNKNNLFTSSVGSAEAIQVMTVHKSKGLEFPVVIYPRMITRNLDNEIWISLDADEFGIPSALVKAKGGKSPLAPYPEFEKELDQQHLDELNVCYVATTRAEDRLYMILEGEQTSKLTKGITAFAKKENENFPSESLIFGEREKHQTNHEYESAEVIAVEMKKTTNWKIKSKRSVQHDEMKYGDTLHRCLQRVKTKSDIPQAIQDIMNDASLFPFEERLRSEVYQIVTHPEIAYFFSGIGKILNEYEIMTADGALLRPDRVIIHDGKVHVLDFKTGNENPDHYIQVKQYMEEIFFIENLPVDGYLIYTRNGEVKKV